MYKIFYFIITWLFISIWNNIRAIYNSGFSLRTLIYILKKLYVEIMFNDAELFAFYLFYKLIKTFFFGGKLDDL